MSGGSSFKKKLSEVKLIFGIIIHTYY